LRLAELIAFDLSLDLKSKWMGWSVKVRKAKGSARNWQPVQIDIRF
jgi:hypothetical protein